MPSPDSHEMGIRNEDRFAAVLLGGDTVGVREQPALTPPKVKIAYATLQITARGQKPR